MADERTRNFRDGVMKIEDGDSSSIVVALDMGNLSWSEARNRVNVLDRGALDHVRNGDEEPVTLSFGCKYRYLRSDSEESGEDISPHEALTQGGRASDWTSTGGTGEPYACQVTFWILNPDTDSKDEKLVFGKCRLISPSFSEGDEANEISFELQDFETAPTITREDYS